MATLLSTTVNGNLQTTGTSYAAAYRGNANVGGTGEATWHPAGIYSTGTNWLYGTMYLNNNTIQDAANIYNSGWYRNYGQTGLYSQTYDNHFASYDSNYWRLASSYGLEVWSKGFGAVRGYLYTDGSSFGLLNSSGQWAVRTYGGSETQLMYNGSWRGIAQSNGFRVNGNLYTDVDYGYGLVGVYTSTRYQGVFAMGDSYKLPADGSSTGSLYGLAWSHPNAGGVAGNLNTHGLLVMENGTFLAAVSGSIRARDDMRAPIFYDSANTAYYGDFASTSALNQMTINYIGVGQSVNTSYRIITSGDYYANAGGNYWAEGRFKQYRGSGTWWNVIDEGNIGSQSVSYASSAGNSDTVDGYHASGLWKLNEWNGNLYAHTDGRIYGTIFYDSNNDAYYVNPNGTSRLNNLQLNETYTPSYTGQLILGSTSYNFNFLNGSWAGSITAGILANCSDQWEFAIHDSGHRVVSPFLFDGGGNHRLLMGRDIGWGQMYIEAASSFRAPIFYDSNNTTYFWDGSAGKSMEVAGGVQLDGLNNSNAYIAFNNASTYWGIIGNYGANDWRIGIGNYSSLTDWNLRWDASGNAWANSSFRAPIFYDSQDTNYYVDPNSTSRVLRMQPLNLGGATLQYRSTDLAVDSGSREAITFIDGSQVQAHVSTGNGCGGCCYNWWSSESVQVDPEKDYEFHVWVRSTGNDNVYLGWWEGDSSGNTITSNPYFHTGGINTGGTWVKLTAKLKNWRTTSPQGNSNGQDRYASASNMSNDYTGTVDGVMHSNTRFVYIRLGTCYGTVSGSKTYFYGAQIREAGYDDYQQNFVIPYYNGSSWGGKLRFGLNDWGYFGIGMYGAAGEFRMSSDSGDLNLRVDGWIQSEASVRAPIFYDSQNTGYYLDPAGSSQLSSVFANDWFRPQGCTGVYFQDYGRGLRAADCEGSYGNVMTYGGGLNGYAGWGLKDASGYRNYFMGESGNVGIYAQDLGLWTTYWSRTNACLGIGTSSTSSSYKLYVNGSIYATGDVVAYSDKRKKTDVVTIDNALDKVTNMRGVFYTKIGEEEKGRQVGVIAQEVKEILPEAVTYAADIDEYGVAYGNIVGVLIEAIKEQQKQIDNLKAKLDGTSK